jgi:hypothetical protein
VFQVALFSVVSLRWAESASLHAELARLRAELSSGAPPAGAGAPAASHAPSHASPAPPHVDANHGAAASSAAAHAPARPAGAAQEFLVRHTVPAAQAPSLAGVPHAAAATRPVAHVESEEVEVRGVCDGCGQNVTSDDEGRKREGDKYYHAGCIKGYCACCHKIVHADAARVVIDGAYWHRDCTRNIGEPSSERNRR